MPVSFDNFVDKKCTILKHIRAYQTILYRFLTTLDILDYFGQGMNHSGEFLTILNCFGTCLVWYMWDHF